MKYNRAKLWQIGLFSLNNTATNLFHALTFYVGYYATGMLGVTTVLISNILTSMRIFDGITDPVIGYFIDKTDGKFGKFRPYMVIGWIIMTISMIMMYQVSHLLPKNTRFWFFLVMYSIYILGYTCQTAVTKAAQACMTNDPKQRPIFGAFDGTYTILHWNLLVPVYVNGYLLTKHGNKFSTSFFKEFLFTFIILSGILTILAIIGLYKKDRTEYFGLCEKNEPINLKNYLDILKNNRAIQMLIIAASTDKIAMTTSGNAAVGIMIYGIIMGDNTLQAKFAMLTIIPMIILLQICTQFARRLGIKKGLQYTATACIIIYSCIFLLLRFINTTNINANNLLGIESLLFIALWSLGKGVQGASGALTINAIADCADYETYRTRRYVPAMMGTMFSFIDKLVSSLANTIIGLVVFLIGYRNAFPQIGDPYTEPLFYAATFLFLGMPILGWIASLIALKFYPLSREKMEEIQKEIALIKCENK